MEYWCSSHTASSSSCTLRLMFWSGVRKRFLASCWVMVEGAFRRMAAVDVGHHGAAYAHRIEAPVLVEAPVLHRHEGCGHVGRQRIDVDGRSVLAAAHRQQGAVPVQIADRGLAVDVVELGGVRQPPREDQHEGGHEDQHPDAQHHGPVDQGVGQGPPGRAGGRRLARRRTSAVPAAGPARGAIGVRHARSDSARPHGAKPAGQGALTCEALQEVKGRMRAAGLQRLSRAQALRALRHGGRGDPSSSAFQGHRWP